MTTSPESLSLLARAAELRAEGTSWSDAATQLAVDHAELRRLTIEHSRDYDRLARRARTEFLRETLSQAIAALRVLLRSPEPGVSLMAATTIVRYDIAAMRNGRKEAGERLERRIRRGRREKLREIDSRNLPELNVSESAEVLNSLPVAAAEKVARPSAPKPAIAPPAPVMAPARPAVQQPAPLDDAKRRKQLLLDRFARRRTAPVTNGTAGTAITSWLAGS